MVGYALPSFVIGMVLVWFFALKLHWLPPAGLADQTLPLDATRQHLVWIDRLTHLMLPLTAMVLATIAVPLRQQRSAVARHRHAAVGARRTGARRLARRRSPGGTAGGRR